MDEQKYYFDITNLTQSLIVSNAWYTEKEPEVPEWVREKHAPQGIYRYYTFTATNSSEKIIEVIAVTHRRDNVIDGLSCNYFKQDRGLKPQESAEVELPSVKPGSTVAIEAIIFRDGTYEGQSWIAEGELAREAAKNAKMVELMTLFKERGLLSTQTDLAIGSNVIEMKALADEEYKHYKAKNTLQDHRDLTTHRGILEGIWLISQALTNVERQPNQQAMRDFIARISLLTGTDISDK